MKYFKIMLAVMMVLMVTGCATWWTNQNSAGIEEWSVNYKDGLITKVHYINGKELGSSDIEIWLADGTKMSLKASDVKAFEGQALRADVEKVIAEQLGEVSPVLLEAILKAVKGGVP